MKTLILTALALAALAAAGPSLADDHRPVEHHASHHARKVCTTHHHHTVCRMVR